MRRKATIFLGTILICATSATAQQAPPVAPQPAQSPQQAPPARPMKPIPPAVIFGPFGLPTFPAPSHFPDLSTLPTLPQMPPFELPALPLLPELAPLMLQIGLEPLPPMPLFFGIESAQGVGRDTERGAGLWPGIANKMWRLEDNDSEGDSPQEREAELYEDGTDYLSEQKWDKAVLKFREVVQLRGKKVDAALYWQAYSENKLGRRQDALQSIQLLVTTYPVSKYVKDAKALEIEIRNNAGQPPNLTQEDCELKLMALNALMHTDEERAIPMLEKALRDPQCPGMTNRALFVLAQSRSPKAWEILVQIAKGERNPDLQRKAIQYIGTHGGRERRQVLSEIYSGTGEVDVKRQILRAWMVGGEKDRLLTAARGEKSADLRREAIRQLGVMGAGTELSEIYRADQDVQVKREILRAYMVAGKKQDLLGVARGETNADLRREAVRQLGVMAARQELVQLYQAESSPEVKAEILQGLFVGGGAEELLQIYRTEKDPALRRRAVRNLGLTGSKATAPLLEIYASDADVDVKKGVIEALFVQGNAKALIDIARKESNPELKKAAVSKLSVMRSKDATEYLLELLSK